MRVLSGQVTGQRVEVCGPGGRQAGGVKRGNRVWVWRIPKDVGWTARSRVEDVRIDLGGILTGARNRAGSWRVEVIRVGVCDLLLVVVDAVAAAEDHPAAGCSRTPVEADLRAEVELLRVPRADSRADGDAGQEACAAAKREHAHVVVLIRERPEVGIAETGAQGKVGTGLPVVLKEDS